MKDQKLKEVYNGLLCTHTQTKQEMSRSHDKQVVRKVHKCKGLTHMLLSNKSGIQDNKKDKLKLAKEKTLYLT